MQEPAPSGLAPGFLVAAPLLKDPNFAGSLVLMAEHHGEGALGFVVNRPGPITVARRARRRSTTGSSRDAAAAGRADASGAGRRSGPAGAALDPVPARPSAPEEGAVRGRAASVALGGSRELLEALVRAPAARPFLLLLGYAGWAPMQVEHEVAAGAWVPMPRRERPRVRRPAREALGRGGPPARARSGRVPRRRRRRQA